MYRASFFQDGWQAFEEMARVQVIWRKRTLAAGLEYAERGRARTLLEASIGKEGAQPVAVSTVQERLPKRTAVLFYMTLDARLLIWTLRVNRVSVVERPISVTTLAARVDRIRWLMRQTGSHATRLRRDLESLFDELIAPMMPLIDDADTIAVVPDGPLHALPFAALIDARTGRYLVQEFVITTAPSLSMLTPDRHPNSPATAAARRALLIGN